MAAGMGACVYSCPPACCCVLTLAERDTSPGHQAPAKVNPCSLLALPVKTSRILCWSPRRLVSLYVKHQTRLPPPGHVSRSMCFTHCSQALQCTGQRVQWSAKVTRPCMQRVGLQPARYIKAAAYRTISRYEMPRYID